MVHFSKDGFDVVTNRYKQFHSHPAKSQDDFPLATIAQILQTF
jgi:hypothetical protein